MAWYKCVIEGQKFPGILAHTEGLVGFRTTRVVEAGTRDEAQFKAIAAIRNDASLQLPEGVNAPRDASLRFESIEEIASHEKSEVDTDFSFYTMGTDR